MPKQTNTTWTEVQHWLGTTRTGPIPQSLPAPQASQFSTDTRSIKTGEWFVPLSGGNFDGHDYIAQAVASGAVGFFYAADKQSKVPPGILPLGLAVSDPLAAMQAFAAGWRSTLSNLRMAAVTGSTGKTTTKELLGGIFRQAGPTYATQASFNNEIGVPKTLLQLTPEQRYAALEFGARMPGNIRFLAEMARPNIVGLINVGITHMGIFGSLENLLATKLEIFNFSPADAIQVAYHDDERILAGARRTGKSTLTFGRSAAADVHISKESWQNDGSLLVHYRLPQDSMSVRFATAHAALAINGAAAAALALAAGVSSAHISQGLSAFAGVKGRYQVHHHAGLTVIDDTYNASPDSMLAGLDSLKRSYPTQRLCVVLGDMLELGPISQAEHRRVGQQGVAPLRPQNLITVGSDAACIAEAAIDAGFPAQQVQTFASADKLIAAKLDWPKYGDIIYAKASNGIKLSKLVENLLGRS